MGREPPNATRPYTAKRKLLGVPWDERLPYREGMTMDEEDQDRHLEAFQRRFEVGKIIHGRA